MENLRKCFTEEHKEIDSISFCPVCRIYMCNKCLNFHATLFKSHHPNNLNKEEDIENPVYDKKEFPENRFFTTLKRNFYQDRTLIESIFYPNKATQKQLSTKGTEIDIMALILYTLRQEVQEPKIYLENKGGLIRDYSITIIIDNSKSCFCELNETHSFLTIINHPSH